MHEFTLTKQTLKQGQQSVILPASQIQNQTENLCGDKFQSTGKC